MSEGWLIIVNSVIAAVVSALFSTCLPFVAEGWLFGWFIIVIICIIITSCDIWLLVKSINSIGVEMSHAIWQFNVIFSKRNNITMGGLTQKSPVRRSFFRFWWSESRKKQNMRILRRGVKGAPSHVRYLIWFVWFRYERERILKLLFLPWCLLPCLVSTSSAIYSLLFINWVYSLCFTLLPSSSVFFLLFFHCDILMIPAVAI